MVSQKDISVICHVSVPTVSKALNGRHDISEKTREKVLRAARDLHYTSIQDAGNSTAHRSCTMNLGILMPNDYGTVNSRGPEIYSDIRNLQILRSFWETAMRAGFDLTILNIDDLAAGQMSYEARCRFRRVDGLCVFARGTAMYEERMMELFRAELPIVTLDQIVDNHTAVLTDYPGGMKVIIEKIIEAGCRQPAYIERITDSGRKSTALFRRCAAESGIIVRENLVRRVDTDTDCIVREVQDLFAQKEAPDCIVFSGGFNRFELREMNYEGMGEAAKDIPVFMFGGCMSGKGLSDRIVSVGEDMAMLGKTAAQRLIFSAFHPEMAAGETVYVPMFFQ